MASQKILDSLKKILSADQILESGSDRQAYGKDWTTRFQPKPGIVVLPKTVQEVAEIVKFCHRSKISLIPTGGRTGLAAGTVAFKEELILSLERLNKIYPIDLVTQTVRVQAGVINQALQQECGKHGLMWPIELASMGSCQIGGNLATNAGGLRVIRYGHVRQWVQSIQAVLPSGEILELPGELEKNNPGYDLKNLIIGSEGTLALITEATLKLTPVLAEKSTFFFGVSNLDNILKLLKKSRELPLVAFEFLSQACLNVTGKPNPLSQKSPYYVLVECEKVSETRLSDWLEAVLQMDIVDDGAGAQSPKQAHDFWACRETITESLSLQGIVYKNDLGLPVKNLPAFVSELEPQLESWYGDCEVFLFGHIGDGNIHINVLKPKPMDTEKFNRMCEEKNHNLYALLKKYGGSIAAEHGVGALKKQYMSYCHSQTELEILKGIKKLLDPLNIMNPGKVID